ncbi:sulfite exporter TauE/SafE family protein [Algiphilus sp.]|uniref:sulfite exporter TauE/SafE family protein n=1 Tax=Algiphilus sp. TaxID=1872431 RepID=UPI0025C4D963|nr:sulfite exporter TauE/SafE family protein [Algiphilus sp.]MCK5768733.1 sulfite exporter TauE/SafE family protein [Algiphilus sp.]
MPIELLYPLVGVATGLIAGLLGVGGGILMVPILAGLFGLQGLAPEHTMHLAVATSLSVIIFTAASSARSHHAHGAVLWPVVRRMVPGLIAGAIVGALLADAASSTMLSRAFGIAGLLVAVQMFLNRQPPPTRSLPGTPGLLGISTVFGAVSALIGIGGGSLTVPYLVWCNTPPARAVGTSSVFGVPIAAFATAGYVASGWHNPALPDWTAGYVYLPALLGVGLVSVLFAPLGARLAHGMPAATLKRCFAVFLALVGLRMLVG